MRQIVAQHPKRRCTLENLLSLPLRAVNCERAAKILAQSLEFHEMASKRLVFFGSMWGINDGRNNSSLQKICAITDLARIEDTVYSA